jgi:hypothetical protein
VPIEPTRVEMRITGDPRLVGPVAAAVEHLAQGAEMGEALQKQLMAAAEQACLETFSRLDTEGTPIEVTLQLFPDRLEIAFSHASSEGPALGLDSFVSLGESDSPSHGAMLMTLVDRVLYDSAGGQSTIRLVKYFTPAGGKPQ